MIIYVSCFVELKPWYPQLFYIAMVVGTGSSMWLSARSAALILLLGGPSTLNLNYKYLKQHWMSNRVLWKIWGGYIYLLDWYACIRIHLADYVCQVAVRDGGASGIKWQRARFPGYTCWWKNPAPLWMPIFINKCTWLPYIYQNLFGHPKLGARIFPSTNIWIKGCFLQLWPNNSYTELVPLPFCWGLGPVWNLLRTEPTHCQLPQGSLVAKMLVNNVSWFHYFLKLNQPLNVYEVAPEALMDTKRAALNYINIPDWGLHSHEELFEVC